VTRLKVKLASSSGVPPAQQLSIGVLGAPGDDGSGPERDVGIALVELFAYVADVLSSYQDKVANEAYLLTDRHEETTLSIRLHADLRPALCLIVDARCAYVVVVGPDTDEASISLGDGAVGEQPPTGSEMISASYRRGAGATGNLALSGLRLEKPFVVVVTGGASTTARRFC
jgi:hypothetical protein